jgi:hypothetical protein
LTAKDKAKELVEKYLFNGDMIDDIRMSEESAIESALICVDEILESLWNVGHSSSNDEIKYWQ